MTEVSLHTWTHGEPGDRVLTQDSNLVQPEDGTPTTGIDNTQANPTMSGYPDIDDVCLAPSRTDAGSTSQISPHNREHTSIESSLSSPVTGQSVLHLVNDTHSDHDDVRARMPHHRNKRLHTTRGLASLTRVPNVIDNRYMLLNLPRDKTARMEPPIKPVRRRNIAPSHVTRGPGVNVRHSPGTSQTMQNRPSVNSSHSSNMYRSHSAPSYSQHGSDYDNYNMPYDDIDQVENLEELENIPAMDEIPYALILTGVLDEVTLRKAQQKQSQRIALEHIRKVAEMQQNRKRGTSLKKNVMPTRAEDKDKQPSMHNALYNSAYELLKETGKLTQQIPHQSTLQLDHNDPLMQQTYDASSFSADVSFGESLQHFDAVCQDMQPGQAHIPPEFDRYMNDKLDTVTDEHQLNGHGVSLQDKHQFGPLVHPNQHSLDQSETSCDLQDCADEHPQSLEICQELTVTGNAKQPDKESVHHVLIHPETDSYATEERWNNNNVQALPTDNRSFISTEHAQSKSGDDTNGGQKSSRTNRESNANDKAQAINAGDAVPMTVRPPGEESKDISPPSVNDTAKPNSHRKSGNDNSSRSSLRTNSESGTGELPVGNEDNFAMMTARPSDEECKETITPSVADTARTSSHGKFCNENDGRGSVKGQSESITVGNASVVNTNKAVLMTSRSSADEPKVTVSPSVDDTTQQNPQGKRDNENGVHVRYLRAHSEFNTDEDISVDNEDDSARMTASPSAEEFKDTRPPLVNDTTQPNSLETRGGTDSPVESPPVSHKEIQIGMNTGMQAMFNLTLQSGTNTKFSVGSNCVPDTSSVEMNNQSTTREQGRIDNNQRKDTDSQRFIRMKRLERYAAGTQDTEPHTVAQSTSPTKQDDNRTKTVHGCNTPTKPLKAKVFKKPLFELSGDSAENNKAHTSGAIDSTVDPTYDGQGNVKNKMPSAMKFLQSNPSVPKEDTHDSKRQRAENARTALMMMMKTTQHAKNSSKRDKNGDVASDHDDEHTMPTLLRDILQTVVGGQSTGIGPLSRGTKNRALSSEKKPATMRLLERRKVKEERLSKSEFDAMLGLTSLLQSGIPTKPIQKEYKSRNKNITPAKGKRNNAQTTVEETIGTTKPPEVKLDLKSSLTVSSESTKTESEVGNLSTAKLRHEAFRLMKQDQTGNQPKCTACGRPECEGQNIKEMKTMVRMAKENGYEIRDVSPDGNCMFAAVIDQLTMYGDARFDAKSLRDSAVSWLVEHPYSNDGTHYSKFVCCEWQVYLQKMYAEGEWGDHVILGAIVEVVGHTIKIFHVRGDKSFWTVLKPTSVDISNDGIHLVLGLVGEFHYTSLRPTDAATSYVPPPTSGPGVAGVTDMRTIKLEGGETINMFRDDYIDTMSEFPVAHFSYLLKTVIPMRYVDAAACYSSALLDSVSATFSDMHASGWDAQIYSTAADGVFHPKIFSNANYQGDTNAMVEAMMIACKKFDSYYTLHFEELYPGFGRIRGPLGLSLPSEGITMSIGTNYSPSGYASYQWTRASGMLFKTWPDSAKSWISRARQENWPSVETVNSIVADGFTVVPFCRSASVDPLNECQIVFVSAEHTLFHEAISKYQKHCFIMFIALCVQTMHDNKAISYRHFKNIFFYACERIPSEYWQTHTGSCVLYMLDSLMRCVKSRNLPNYFIDTCNMIDHLTDAEIRDLDERLVLLRSQPELFLKNINSNLERSKLIDTLIERVSQNIPQFTAYLDLKTTSLNVFVPASIDLAQGYIKIQQYDIGYELLSSAFQERLSISSCNEMVPYQMFITAAVSGLDLESQVWFCAYTDKQLEGQLSKSLIRETCGDLELTTIQTILPSDICGSFANTEVPKHYAATPCAFCDAFVRFLYSVQKMSDVSSVLQYCHRVFKDKRQRGEGNNAAQHEEDFNGYNMFNIYTDMFWVNHQQGQLQAFKSVLPEVKFVCQQISTRWAYECLKYIYKSLGDEMNMSSTDETCKQLPEDQNDGHLVNLFHSWPRRYPMSY